MSHVTCQVSHVNPKKFAIALYCSLYHDSFVGVSGVIWGCSKGVNGVSQGCGMGVSGVWHGCFKGVRRLLQGCSKGVRR